MSHAPSHSVLSTLLTLAIVLAGTQAHAVEAEDSATFYARHPGQLFKEEPVDMTVGFLEGQEVPYQTWEGMVSGQKVYVELHGAKLRLKVEQRWVARHLKVARRLKGERMTELDPRGTALYVSAGADGKPTTLCLESLRPGNQRAVPVRSVYVVTKALTSSPGLYQLPGLYAACRGVVDVTGQGRAGDAEAPVWVARAQASGAPSYQIRYHRLGGQGWLPTAQTFSAQAVGDQPDAFTFTQP